MTKDEIRLMLRAIPDVRAANFSKPTEADWASLETFFDSRFPPEFKAFIELMAEFSFPGDIYNVTSAGQTNGNDLIATVYANEKASSNWPARLVPFYGIGNGDYFALGADDGLVYYRYHEDQRVEKYSASFEEWLRRLPSFMNGE